MEDVEDAPETQSAAAAASESATAEAEPMVREAKSRAFPWLRQWNSNGEHHFFSFLFYEVMGYYWFLLKLYDYVPSFVEVMNPVVGVLKLCRWI